MTPEMSPFAKVGGLADVSGALPDALAELGHEVRVILPLYRRIDRQGLRLTPLGELGELRLKMGRVEYGYRVLRAERADSAAELLLVDCPALYDREGVYTQDADEHLRFLLLCRASLEICQHLGWAPQIFHCHDWQAAMICAYLKSSYAWDQLFSDSRSLLTLHNIGYQGAFSAEQLGDLGLEGNHHHLDADDLKAGTVNLLKTGMVHADQLSTVSPSYAKEIQTDDMGFGLAGMLRERSAELVGILNGVDSKVWNPRTDEHIPFRYSAKSPWRKSKNKAELLRSLELEPGDDAFVIGAVTRLTWQKGLDLTEQPLDELLESENVRVVVVGSGEEKLERMFTQLQDRHPGKLHVHRGFSEKLAHLVEAGSDVFLMPSRYEPCGLNQMYSQAYGTIPIVRRTGGLADSVEQIDPDSAEGTGILFDHTSVEAVRWALRTALTLYRMPRLWRRIQRNGMERDFSWKRRAAEYSAVYEGLVAAQA